MAGDMRQQVNVPSEAPSGGQGGQPVSRIGYGALAVLVCGGTLGGLGQTAMNTALSSAMVDLEFSVALGQWLVTVFSLCLGVIVPLVPALMRHFSIRRLFPVALSLYVAGSLCLVSGSSFAGMLVGRILQGISAGTILPLVQTVALTRFPREKRGTVMGFVGLAMGFAPNVSPTIMGAMTSALGWRSGFALYGVLAMAIIAAAMVVLRPEPPRASEREGAAASVDARSVTYSTLGFGGLLLGFSQASDFGFMAWECWAPLLAGLAFVAAFFVRQLRLPQPLVDVRVFTYRAFAAGAAMICLLFGAFIGMTLVIPLSLQTVQGYSALQAGLVMLPGTVAALIMNPVSGMLLDRAGARAISLCGSILLLAGTAFMLHLGEMDMMQVAACQTIRAFGISSLIAPITTWSANALPRRLVPDGTSMLNTVNQVAAALGTALMVLLMAGGVADGPVTATGADAAVMFSLAATAGLLVLVVVFVRGRGHESLNVNQN